MAGITSAIIGAGAGLIGAKKSAKAAKKAAAATKPTPYAVKGTAGTSTVNGNQITLDAAANPFAQLATTGGTAMGANAYAAPGSAYYGAPKEVVDAANAAKDTSADTNDHLQQLRDMAAPESNRQAVSLRDRLFGRGTLGSTAGAEEQRAFLESENQADLGRQMTAVDWANQRAQTRFQNALSATGFGANTQQQQFNQFTASQAVANKPFENLIQQTGIGVAAGGGQSPGAAMTAAQAAQVPWQMGAQAVGALAPAIGDYFKKPAMVSMGPTGYQV